MDYSVRKEIYKEIEKERDSKVVAFVTGTRPGLEIHIAPDCIPPFTELLEQIGKTKRISLILHTNGGNILTAHQLVNLIRMFCEDLEVIVPVKAMSAGTLIAIGSDRIIMTRHATLGPIDPSINSEFNPVVNFRGIEHRVSVSVESVRGYLDIARKELGIQGEETLSAILQSLTGYIHPLVLGEIFRSQAQIRFLAEQLLSRQVLDDRKRQAIIDFLCSDSGSHDYTINLREANQIGLNASALPDPLQILLRKVQESFTRELQLSAPFHLNTLLKHVEPNTAVEYSLPRGLIEGTYGKSYRFLNKGTASAVKFPDTAGKSDNIKNNITFQGWEEYHE